MLHSLIASISPFSLLLLQFHYHPVLLLLFAVALTVCNSPFTLLLLKEPFLLSISFFTTATHRIPSFTAPSLVYSCFQTFLHPHISYYTAGSHQFFTATASRNSLLLTATFICRQSSTLPSSHFL